MDFFLGDWISFRYRENGDYIVRTYVFVFPGENNALNTILVGRCVLLEGTGNEFHNICRNI